MDLYAFPPIAAVLDGAHAVLMGLADLLEPLVGVTSAAAAVVLVTLLVRAALIPVGVSQAKAERTRARLAPQLAALQRKHQKNPDRLQREMMSLYQSEGTTPLAGCLPMLIQAPVVGIIYALFILPTIAGHPNDLLTHTLFGVPLGSSLAGSIVAGTVTPDVLLVFGAVVVMIAAVGEVTRRVFRPQATVAPAATTGSRAGAPASPFENPTAVRLLGLAQFITAVIAVFVPLAAGLYLLVTVAWTLGQRMLLRRVYPLPAPSAA
ncbi:YidC/Oxa1 family membrane protein insertase [Agromyces sp. SYSU K20354]|uniref:YidC/Oxa1 family membrane protein insertase n=1 Tax=Agromyces cavernae TaxID=2898659 RepID=UPI001E33C72B|nr:membrane protein insertase YidC [Agromyces cavernae]MCD2441594.1 YidC/Oxa1 family membrane protein insertase [Agromyces cavernae]